MDAAIAVFARNGYHGTRVSDIATRAGIAYGLVYHYFKNKEEILSSIFEERWTGFLDQVDAIAREATPTREKLVAIASRILDAYRTRPDWVRVLVLEIQRSSRFNEPHQLHAIGRLFQIIGRIVRQGQQSGELRAELDPDIACFVFIGALDIVITSLVLDMIKIERSGAAAPQDFQNLAETVVEIFLGGAAAGGRSE